MPDNRRQFLKQALTGALWIGAGNTLKAFEGFALPAKDKVRLRIAVASDGHFGQPGTDFSGMHTEMVAWINAEKKQRGLDFTLINGDLFHDDRSLIEPVKQAWDKLSTPYYVSHGNHDMISEDEWEKTFTTRWHYGFEKKDFAFVVLNTADDKGTYISPDIEKTRALLETYNRKPLFIFMHITPMKWTKHGIDAGEVVALFNKQSNLKAVFHGHDHDQDNMKTNEGVHYFFDSHVGGNWGTSYRGYRILEVMKNGDMLTYQMNPAEKEKVNNFSS